MRTIAACLLTPGDTIYSLQCRTEGDVVRVLTKDNSRTRITVVRGDREWVEEVDASTKYDVLSSSGSSPVEVSIEGVPVDTLIWSDVLRKAAVVVDREKDLSILEIFDVKRDEYTSVGFFEGEPVVILENV